MENIKFYDTEELDKRILKEKKVIAPHLEDAGDNMLVYVKNKNYKLVPKYKADVNDLNKYDLIKSYYELKEYFKKMTYNGTDKYKKALSRQYIKSEVDRLNNTKCKNTDYKLTESNMYRIAMENVILLQDDMNLCKLSIEQPLVFKEPLKDSVNKIENFSDIIDMFDIEQVKSILLMDKSIIVCADTNVKINTLIDLCELNLNDRIILEMYRRNINQDEISKLFKVNQSSISKKIDRIVNKIINAYEEYYEDNYYYVYMVKGEYKKCNCCGEYKLIKRFDKDKKSKDGYKNKCKKCRKK